MTCQAVLRAGLWLFLVVSSCRQIIGIEDAELAPKAAQHGAGGAAGSPNDALAASSQSESQGGTSGTGSASGGADALPSAAAGAAGAAELYRGESGASGAAGAGGEGAAPNLCSQYCQTVMANCSGAFAVYASLDACLAVCAALPPGTSGDRDVNTVQCRLHAAAVAKDEVPHYCPIAGPGGNGDCGTNCEGLCQLRQQICGEFAAQDVAECRAACAKLPDLGGYSTDLSAGQYSGPHVQCRLYHVSAAAVDDAELHCRHVDGAAPCH